MLLLLLRYLGDRELNSDAPELKRAFEVMDILTTKYGFNINSKDSRGYNLLHTIGLRGSIVAF